MLTPVINDARCLVITTSDYNQPRIDLQSGQLKGSAYLRNQIMPRALLNSTFWYYDELDRTLRGELKQC